LGDESGYDALDGLAERAARARAEAVPQAPGPNPTEAEGGLSLEPRAYTGAYANEHWGTLHVALEDGRLVGRLGILDLELVSEGPDAFTAIAPGALEASGHFERDGRDEVVAVSLLAAGGVTVRFER
jgi:hypothetical protein